MKPLTVAIVDDEPLALRRLEIALHDFDDVEIAGRARDGIEAMAVVERTRPDCVFLDIKMPALDGFQLATMLSGPHAPIIVFVTAFDHFAVRAFEAAAVDYLLKPVEFDRLSAAIERVRRARASRAAEDRVVELSALLEKLREEARPEAAAPRYEAELWVRERGRLQRIPVAEIERIEAERDYACLYWEGRTILHRATMASLESRLDPKVMLRVHRSAFVNWKRLRAVRRSLGGQLCAILDSGAELRVGRRYAAKVIAELRGRAGWTLPGA